MNLYLKFSPEELQQKSFLNNWKKFETPIRTDTQTDWLPFELNRWIKHFKKFSFLTCSINCSTLSHSTVLSVLLSFSNRNTYFKLKRIQFGSKYFVIKFVIKNIVEFEQKIFPLTIKSFWNPFFSEFFMVSHNEREI